MGPNSLSKLLGSLPIVKQPLFTQRPIKYLWFADCSGYCYSSIFQKGKMVFSAASLLSCLLAVLAMIAMIALGSLVVSFLKSLPQNRF